MNHEDGSVSIQKGKVKITNQIGLGRYPSIIPGENVDVFVNGTKIITSTVVSENDNVIIIPHNYPGENKFEVEITEDRMNAFLRVIKKKGQKVIIPDQGPSLQLNIYGIAMEEDPPVISVDEILKLLKNNGIVYGIKQEAILKVVASSDQEIKVEVASGKPPAAAGDYSIYFPFFEKQAREKTFSEYSNKPYIATVGDILAIKRTPDEKTKYGIDVTGKIVEPKEEDTEIIAGDGVKLIKEGRVAVAAISGRVIVEGEKQNVVTVRPVRYLEGAALSINRQISFDGDVIIEGNVLEGTKISAHSYLEIFGNVAHATLEAGQNIIIKGKILSSQISAGVVKPLQAHIYSGLEKVAQRTANLLQAIKILKNQSAFTVQDLAVKGDGQLISLLLDYKFKDLPQLIVRLESLQHDSKAAPEISPLINLLIQKLCDDGPRFIKSYSEIEALLQKTNEALEYFKTNINRPSDIVAEYVQTSFVKTNGNIIITGSGSLSSELEAGKSIFVRNGIVRGGNLVAREEIEIAELGSNNNSEVNIKLFANCRLKANVVYPGVVIEYEGNRYLVEKIYHGFSVSLSRDGFFHIDYAAS